MGRRWKVILGASALLVALAFAVPVLSCAGCGGRRNPWLDADPAWRAEVLEQVKACGGCGGAGRQALGKRLLAKSPP